MKYVTAHSKVGILTNEGMRHAHTKHPWLCPGCLKLFTDHQNVSAIFRALSCLECGFNTLQEDRMTIGTK